MCVRTSVCENVQQRYAERVWMFVFFIWFFFGHFDGDRVSVWFRLLACLKLKLQLEATMKISIVDKQQLQPKPKRTPTMKTIR